MSGHSKWSSIKHKKAKEDAKRGRIFSKMSQKIILAAREGGGDPETNPTLASAIDTAKSYSMPNDNIKRAIKRGTGELGGAKLEQMTFEGYGANGVAILVDVLTDNRNRASSDIRHIFTRVGGSLGTVGCVSWVFEKKGVILIPKDSDHDEEELLMIAMEAGADDLLSERDYWEVVTDVEHFGGVKKALEDQGIEFESAQLTMFPKNTVTLAKEDARKVLRLVEELEELDDVHDVYSNFDIPDEVLEEVSS